MPVVVVPTVPTRAAAERVGIPDRAPVGQWPLTGPLLGVLVGLVVAVVVDVRLGLLTLGASLAVAATLRLMLPERTCGWLANRTRALDVALLIGCAAGLVFAVFYDGPTG